MLSLPRLVVGDVRVPRLARRLLARRLRRAGQAAGVPAPLWATLGVRIVEDAEMARLHLEFMGEPGPTDVMAFPPNTNDDERAWSFDGGIVPGDDGWDDEDASDTDENSDLDDEDFNDGDLDDQDLDAVDVGAGALGDIVIDWQQVRRQARDGSLISLVDEATILLVHGLCHLLGHDHRRRGEGLRMHRAEARLLRALHVPDVHRPYAAGRGATPPTSRGTTATSAGIPHRAGRAD